MKTSQLDQELIRSAFRNFILHHRFKTVAEELNAEGHRTVNGALFTGQAVARIIRDRKHVESGAVSQELWDEAQAILDAKERFGGSKRRVAHLFSGLIMCGACDGPMYPPSKSKNYVCQSCRNKIGKDDLEAIVLEKLRVAGSVEIKEAIKEWPNLSFSQRRELIELSIKEIKAEGKKVSLILLAFGQ